MNCEPQIGQTRLDSTAQEPKARSADYNTAFARHPAVVRVRQEAELGAPPFR